MNRKSGGDFERNLIKNISTKIRILHTVDKFKRTEILNKSKKGDFVFMDPPYKEEHDYQFNYNKDEKIDNKFMKTLYNEVKKLDKKNVEQ